MDNVTHSLTGILLARAGLHRVTPRATLLLLIASNLPDLDTVATFGGALAYLEYHRWWTHGLALAPVLGLLLTLCTVRIKGWKFLPVFLVSTLGVLAHVLLDMLNNYGVRLWLPFRADWLSWDLVMVIDPWLLLVLLVCVLAPMLSRLVSGEIGGKAPAVGGGWAMGGLLFFALWVGGRWVLHERAVETLRARNYAGLPPLRVAAWPTPWSPLAWNGYVATEQAWLLHKVDLAREFDPEAGVSYFKPEASDALNAARRTPEAQAFLRFAQFPVWRILPVAEPEGGQLLEATDVRFGAPEDGKFQLQVVVDASGKPVSSTFAFGNPLRGMGLIRQ